MRDRFAERVAAWRIEVERVSETTTALLAFGVRDHQPVVLKVVKDGADEWRAGEG